MRKKRRSKEKLFNQVKLPVVMAAIIFFSTILFILFFIIGSIVFAYGIVIGIVIGMYIPDEMIKWIVNYYKKIEKEHGE